MTLKRKIIKLPLFANICKIISSLTRNHFPKKPASSDILFAGTETALKGYEAHSRDAPKWHAPYRNILFTDKNP